MPVADGTTSTAAAYNLLASIVVLAAFAISTAMSMVGVWFIFGTPAIWMVLFALGWYWHGKAALWLLLVAPIAFGKLAAFFLFATVFGLRFF